MTPEFLSEKLLAAAKSLKWPALSEPNFTARKFRGRDDESTVTLPGNAIGLRLGVYPTLVAPISLASSEEVHVYLRALHNQMIIARSYMGAEEVINAHIMLCVVKTEVNADWRGIIDFLERDQTVCRKVVWMPNADALEASYEGFLARTFLAQPWQTLEKVLDAPLDHNEGLAERIFIKHGLSAQAAKNWVSLAEAYKDDPDGLIPQLVAARGEAK